MKVFIVGTAYNYAQFINNYKLTTDINEADIVLFTGGADVDPEFYNEKRHPKSFTDSSRDFYEKVMFGKAIMLKKNILGICRGSQFLTVMCGGSLIQDVDNHAIGGTHAIKFNTKEVMNITSTHHQMMNPFVLDKDKYELIAYSHPTRGTYHENGYEKNVIMPYEPEIVYYPEQRALAIQGHPEYMDKEMPIIYKINDLIKTLFYEQKV